MPKLIPLSKQKMKEMGIVQTKKGFMVNLTLPKKEKKVESKEKVEVREETKKKPVTQKVVIVEKTDKKAERQRLEARGIYQ